MITDKDRKRLGYFTRRFIRVQVENLTDNLAEGCKASLEVLRRPENCRSPSGETKVLRWDSGQPRQVINPHDNEILQVVFSDKRIDGKEGFAAWIATDDAVLTLDRELAPERLCIGETDVEIKVQPRFGDAAHARFRVFVSL